MNYFFVTDELPRPGLAGHLALNHAIIAWLREQGHQVTVLLTGSRLGLPLERYEIAKVAGPEVRQFGKSVVSTSPAAAAGILARILRNALPPALKSAFRSKKYGLADAVLGAFITPAQIAWCAACIEKAQPDALLIDTIFRAPLLRSPQLAGIGSVIVTHDVFYRRHLAFTSAGYTVYPAALSRALEAELLNHATAIAAIQPAEAAILRELCPAKHVFTAPMPARPCPRPAGTARLPARLVFVGSASLPNLDGLRWFLADVWPRLRAGRGNITLDIAGPCGAALGGLPAGVNRLGLVADLAPVLHRAALAIAPLRAGSGLKIKILDYARHGLITVGTPASLEGFISDKAAPFIAATGKLAFASAIIKQLDNAADDTRALAYISRHYGIEASFRAFGQALKLPFNSTLGELRRAE